jgi:hypothetical protein
VIITGITGSIHHGKTTFADLLADQSRSAIHVESWELVAEVANALHGANGLQPAADDIAAINEWLVPLADIVATHMHTRLDFTDIRLTSERLQEHPEYYAKLFDYLRAMAASSELANTDITIETKEVFRPLLQWLGGYLVIVAGSGVWYDEIIRRLTNLRALGYDLATVGGVRYPGDAERLRNAGGIILQIERPNLPTQDARDLTERERSLIQPDAVIRNNGSLEQLAICAKTVYRDLSLRQLYSEYDAV